MRTDAQWLADGRKGIWVPVSVLRTREAYGRTDVLVRPVGGDGEAWVSESNLKASNDPRWTLARCAPGEQSCDCCGWKIMSDTHYQNGTSHHCVACHPIDSDYRHFGDSERA